MMFARADTRQTRPNRRIAQQGRAVELVEFFTGKWLNTVDAKGRVSVPASLRKVVTARMPESKALILARH